MFTFDIRRAGRQICLALQMSPERKTLSDCAIRKQQQQANLLDSKMLGSPNLNYCYSCDFRIWSACPYGCRLKNPKRISYLLILCVFETTTKTFRREHVQTCAGKFDAI